MLACTVGTIAYTLSRLPVGRYKLYFKDATSAYRAEWYDNRVTRPPVPNLAVTTGGTTILKNAALARK